MLDATLDAATMDVSAADFVADAFALFLAGARPAAILVRIVGQTNSPAILQAEFEPTMGETTMAASIPAASIAPRVSLWFSSDGRKFDHDDIAGPNLSTSGRLARRVELRATVDIDATSRAGGVVSVADIEVFDQDRAIEATIADFNFDGLPTEIYLGPKGASRAEYRRIAVAYGSDQRSTEDGRLTFRLQDLQFGLDRPIQTRTFAGTGGLEGDSPLAGRLKPRLFGRRQHFQPVLINPGERWWQYNDGAAVGVARAFYGGEAIPVTQVGTFLEFANAVVAEGAAVDCPQLGLIRDRPAGGIEAPFAIDAVGDATFSTSYRLGDLVSKVLRAYAGFTLDMIDLPGLAALNRVEGGFWADGSSEIMVRQVVETLAADAGGRIVPASVVSAFALRPPETAGFEFAIKESEIRSFRYDGRYSKAVASIRVRFRPNDLVLSSDQVLLPANDPDFKRYVQTDGDLTAPNPDAAVALIHRDFDVSATIETSALNAEDAAIIADRMRGWFGKERRVFELVTTSRRALTATVGQIVRITRRGYPFAGGRNAYIVKCDQNFDTLTTRMRVVL